MFQVFLRASVVDFVLICARLRKSAAKPSPQLLLHR